MITLHVTTASLALLLGALVFLMPKGTRLHRRIGLAYVGAMAIACITAFFLYGFSGHLSFFHALAALTLVNLALGIHAVRRAVRTGNRALIRRHYGFLAGSYVAPVAALAGQLVPPLLPLDHRTTLVAVVLGTSLVGVAMVRYFSRIVGRYAG